MKNIDHPCWGQREEAEGTWEEIAELIEKKSPKDNGELYIGIGSKVVCAFIGLPHALECLWHNDQWHEATERQCSDPRYNVQLRVRMNIWIPATGKTCWLEMSSRLFKDIYKARDKYGLDKWLFEIERHDEDTFSVLPEARIDDELRQRIEAAHLYDLRNVWRDT